MPTETVPLDLAWEPTTATLLYLAHFDGNGPVVHNLQFLHKVRDPRWLRSYPAWASSPEAAAYYQTLPQATEAYYRLLGDQRFNAYVSPPSRRNDAEPYRAVAMHRIPYPLDLTRFFKKKGEELGGHAGSPETLAEHFELSYNDSLHDVKTLLIVDDAFSNGTTAGAIVIRLRKRGLPGSALITIATPLRAHRTRQLGTRAG